jgi:hypothetical protein
MNNRLTLLTLALAMTLGTLPIRSIAANCPFISVCNFLSKPETIVLLTSCVAGGALAIALDDGPSKDARKVYEAQKLCRKIEHAYKDKSLAEIICDLQKNSENVAAFKRPYHTLEDQLLEYNKQLRKYLDTLEPLPAKKAFECIHHKKEVIAQIITTFELVMEVLEKTIEAAEYKTEIQQATA